MVPTDIATLIVPAATVAEVVSRPRDLKPLPAVEPWVVGYFHWRNYPVTLVSFERIASDRDVPEYSRVCVFHPLPGRQSFDYFALTMNGEPRSLEITDSADAGAVPAQVAARFVAGTVQHVDRTLVIPDFGALQAVFYPDAR